MKVCIVMGGLGGELAREVIDMPDGELTMSELAARVEWIVKPGDTIRFEEVED